MTFLGPLLRRLHWLNLPGVLLIALLQRTPVLRVLVAGAEQAATSPVGQLTGSIFVVATLGTPQALAGATTFIVNQGNTQIIKVELPPAPPVRNPATGSTGTAITPVAFTYTGTPTPAATFRVTGSLPPGLSFFPAPLLPGVIRANTPVVTGTPTQAGTFTVFVQGFDALGDTNNIQEPIVFNIAGSAPVVTSRLANLSVRTPLAAGQTLIVGVVVSDGARDVLVRAAGPALAAFGLTGTMVDPSLDLFSGSNLVFSNDNWAASLAPVFTSVGAFAFAAQSRDAAFVRSLNAAYSIQAHGTGAGIVLVEAYDTGAPTAARLVNVSARNQVGTGDNILIAGFNISGTSAKPLLIRAVGPKLAAFGVGGVLADPKLEIYDGFGTLVTENDNWTPALATTFAAVGAFALDLNSRDAALLVTLPPGSYTAQVRGADGGTGEALIEIYEVR